jgi:hypothetical protein
VILAKQLERLIRWWLAFVSERIYAPLPRYHRLYLVVRFRGMLRCDPGSGVQSADRMEGVVFAAMGFLLSPCLPRRPPLWPAEVLSILRSFLEPLEPPTRNGLSLPWHRAPPSVPS